MDLNSFYHKLSVTEHILISVYQYVNPDFIQSLPKGLVFSERSEKNIYHLFLYDSFNTVTHLIYKFYEKTS